MEPKHDTIVILDYGSQYSQLIARRVREQNVYCVVLPWNSAAASVMIYNPLGFILSGGPNSVYDQDAPRLPSYVLNSGRPILGICYGMQLLTHQLGGAVGRSLRHEYGPAALDVDEIEDQLFDGWNPRGTKDEDSPTRVWMSHGDKVEKLAPGFESLAHTGSSTFAAMVDRRRRYYAVQFHPEVAHSRQGRLLLNNFVLSICDCSPTWTTKILIEEQTAALKQKIGDGKVILALSGGVDSSVVAALINRAVGQRLSCIFVDHGLLRQGEALQVIETFEELHGMRLVVVHAVEEFMDALAGVIDPEMKRRIIGERFIRVFEREAQKLGRIDFLAQGTIYPDVIESSARNKDQAHTIKTHHNVGGLPESMSFKLVEPLRQLFKDEVRQIGAELGLPERIIWRQPFPGPGLAIRCLGEVTWDRLETLRAADSIFRDELARVDMIRQETQQAFAILLPVRSVGVMGDGRSYEEVVALRAVTTEDFMTADWARLPYELLERASNRIVNEVPGVNRVVYDITSKPPGTIEWE
ncbi:MAG TPA: glutamine-hydrolyzing GMP synthase [Patescibacteria group bacterium]|nr:glutamine-hydrolyzing GMP synthase [Patescibacteria group bacterium]